MKKTIKQVVFILLLLSFTMIFMGCESQEEVNSGPCPQNKTCWAKWKADYSYEASSCGRSSCAVKKAGEKQLTASCDCK